tara:strand:- start:1801 stop:2523 length:723 start_codon:yes stop_codon:yes gene_type:complete
MYLSLKSSLNTDISRSVTPPPAPETNLRFYGATSVLGGPDYQMGQLWHDVAIGANGVTSVLVTKTNQSTDVDISNFNNTGTVSAQTATTFQLRAIGSRNGSNSTLRGGNTEDSIGINGGNPGKIDVVGTNQTEYIKWEVRDLDPALTFKIKGIAIIQYAFGDPGPLTMSMELTDFSSVAAPYIPLQGGNPALPLNFTYFGSQDVTIQGAGPGLAGTFRTGIEGENSSSFGIYTLDFDVTG